MFGKDDDSGTTNSDNTAVGGLPFTPPNRTTIPAPVADATLDDSASVSAPADPSPTPMISIPTPLSEPQEQNNTNDQTDSEDASSLSELPDQAKAPEKPSSTDNDGLEDIKLEALKHLTPLVEKLDQTPDEKFRTTMMMMQASDDESLVKTAFETAKQIEDDKDRAQALLDVINEINYFTQQNEA